MSRHRGQLFDLVGELLVIGEAHPKCVRCHCYRDVGREVVEVARCTAAPPPSPCDATDTASEPIAPTDDPIRRLSELLSSVEAGHG